MTISLNTTWIVVLSVILGLPIYTISFVLARKFIPTFCCSDNNCPCQMIYFLWPITIPLVLVVFFLMIVPYRFINNRLG